MLAAKESPKTESSFWDYIPIAFNEISSLFFSKWLSKWAMTINMWEHNLIALGDFNIDPDRIEEKITSKTKAIMPVAKPRRLIMELSLCLWKLRRVASR